MEIKLKYEMNDILEYRQYFNNRYSSKNKTYSNYIMFMPALVLIINLFLIDDIILIIFDIVVISIFFFWYFKNIFRSKRILLKQMQKAFPYFNVDNESNIQFSKNEIIIESSTSKCKYLYSSVEELIDNRNYYYLVLKSTITIIIPKSQLSELEREKFINELKVKCKKLEI